MSQRVVCAHDAKLEDEVNLDRQYELFLEAIKLNSASGNTDFGRFDMKFAELETIASLSETQQNLFERDASSIVFCIAKLITRCCRLLSVDLTIGDFEQNWNLDEKSALHKLPAWDAIDKLVGKVSKNALKTLKVCAKNNLAAIVHKENVTLGACGEELSNVTGDAKILSDGASNLISIALDQIECGTNPLASARDS